MIAASGSAASARPAGLAQAEPFRLGDLDVRPSTREVIGQDCSILLEPRVMQVLVLLAARRGKVVSRSDLTEHCWAGQVVGDDAINRCIQAIRRLAERCGGFSIRTVARVGYRLDEEARGGAATAVAGRDLATPVHSGPAHERRRLTVLSCSPVLHSGSVTDLEVRYDILRQWRHIVGGCAAPFGAFLDIGRGERILACFGYPDALEDAGERAVRAGLAIVDGLGQLNDRLLRDHGVELTLRVGIHADDAVIGYRPDGGVELFGAALDRAIALEERARPGSIVITDEIRDNVVGRFVIESIDGQEPKSGGAMHAVRSAGLAGERRPVERSVFVGRQEELGLLAGRWQRVKGGAGQLVLIHGEPGIGKSRLIGAFRKTLASEPHLWIECRGEQLFSNTPLHASTQMLWQGLGWRGDESPEERSATLERAIERSGIGQAEAFPLLTAMLGLPLPESHSPLLLSPEQRRRRLLATLAGWLFSGCRFQPLVLVVEDLHWLDPSSLELLHTLAEQGVCHPLMLLCTARPEFHSPWPTRSHHLQLALGGLLPDEISMLVGDVASPLPLSSDAIEAIVERADGVPLFAEALTRLIRDGESATEIPATLMDSLAARLDRIGSARDVAQIGAVIGRSFTWELLRQLTPVADEDLQLSLERLVDAGLIQTDGTALDICYRFRHALVREAAYRHLLTSRRRDLHRRVAEALARQRVPPRPEELAQHWALAGCLEQAVAGWVDAGASAYRRHAFAEAASSYRDALDLLAALPESAQRDALEMTYSAAYSLALVPTAGAQAPEVIRLAARNHELAQRGGDIGRLVTARTYAFLAAMFRGEWAEASHLAQQVLSLISGEPSKLPPVTRAYGRAMGHYCHFTAAFYRGELREAEGHFLEWEALNQIREYEEQAVIANAYSNAAILAWQLGDEAEAERRIECARAHALAVDSPFDRCTCLMMGALLNVFRNKPTEVEDFAAASVELARHWNFAQVEGWAGAALGWARAQLGSPAEGTEILRSNLLSLAKSETRVSLPFFLTMLAESQALSGDADGALTTFEEALSVCPPERLYRPHTLTCLGEHLASLGRCDEAKAAFREAIATAEMMTASTVKARASTGLATIDRAQRAGDSTALAVAGQISWGVIGKTSANRRFVAVVGARQRGHQSCVIKIFSQCRTVSTADSVRILIDAWTLMTGRFDGHIFASEDGVATTFANRPLPFFNLSAIDRPLQPDEFRHSLVVARARADQVAHPSMLAICGDQAPEGWENLAADAGWLRSMHLVGMAADRLRPERRERPELDYRLADDPATSFDIGLVNALAYGMAPEDFGCRRELSLWAEGAFGIVGYDVGRPVTAAASFLVGDVIYVAMVASVPGLHGRGYAEAAMRRAIEEAQDAVGHRRIWLHATEPGAPLYRSMGFDAGAAVTMLHLAAP